MLFIIAARSDSSGIVDNNVSNSTLRANWEEGGGGGEKSRRSGGRGEEWGRRRGRRWKGNVKVEEMGCGERESGNEKGYIIIWAEKRYRDPVPIATSTEIL